MRLVGGNKGFVALVVAFGACGCGARNDDEQLLRRLQAHAWVVESLESGGKVVEPESIGVVFLPSKGSVTITIGAEVHKGVFAIDSGKDPIEIDLSPDASNRADPPLKGIFAFDRDESTLTMCFSPTKRPKAFKTAPDSDNVVITLRRAPDGNRRVAQDPDDERLKREADEKAAREEADRQKREAESRTARVEAERQQHEAEAKAAREEADRQKREADAAAARHEAECRKQEAAVKAAREEAERQKRDAEARAAWEDESRRKLEDELERLRRTAAGRAEWNEPPAARPPAYDPEVEATRLLRDAQALLAQRQTSSAARPLTEVVRRFPHSSAAGEARLLMSRHFGYIFQ